MANPRAEILRKIPEIWTIASIARDLGTDILLHGSVAATLLNPAYQQVTSVESLFDLVPPLSDIDVLVCSPPLTLQVRAEILRQLPVGNFFHWEVRSPEQLNAYHRGAHVQLRGQPNVLFVPPGSQDKIDNSPRSRAVISLSLEGELEIHVSEDSSTSDISIRGLDKSLTLSDANIGGALRDLFYLARWVPDQLGEDEAIQNLCRYLKNLGGDAAAQALLRSPAELSRTTFALAKYLLARAASPSPASYLPSEPFLGEQFWNDLSEIRDPIFRELARRAETSVDPFKLVVLPRRIGSRWKRQIVDLGTLDDEESVAKKEFLANWRKFLHIEDKVLSDIETKGQSSGMFLSPVVNLRAADPPDPRCCTYRDFSRGIAEVAWAEPVPPTNSIRPVNALIFIPDLQEHFFAHSYLTTGKASSLRLDYGFLSTLAGGRHTLKVLGLGVDRED